MKRQLDDYYSKFYTKLAARSAKINAKDYQLAKDIAQWKEAVAERWDSIKVVSSDTNVLRDGADTGTNPKITYVIDEQGLNDAVGLELVILKNDQETTDRKVNKVEQFKLVKQEGNLYTFECQMDVKRAGSYKTCVRMYPKNDLLPHRQDFCYVKWLD
jgi:starch phosphorylase